MRKLVLKKIKVWVSQLKCDRCGRKTELHHRGQKTKKDALKDLGEYWNGWKLQKDNHLCPYCIHYQRKNKKLSKSD